MAIQRMDHVGVVADDLDHAVRFFVALGMEVDGDITPVQGRWVDQVVGLEDVLWRLMFAVDDLDDTVARLRDDGGELLGEIALYGDVFRLCYVRGPGGIIVALAETLG